MTKPSNKPPSPAQNAARARNWRIRNLRALHSLSCQLTGERRAAAFAAIDEELKLLGAETYDERVERMRREFADTDIPF